MNSHFGFLKSLTLFVIAGVWFDPTITCNAQGIVDCAIQDRVRAPSVRAIVADPTGFPIPDTLIRPERDVCDAGASWIILSNGMNQCQ
jgi:hypothetical protein